MKTYLNRKTLSLFLAVMMILSLVACNDDEPVVTETPESVASADPTQTPTPTESEEESTLRLYFDRNLVLKPAEDSMFPDSAIKLGNDGTFEFDIPNVGKDEGSYEINGDQLEVTSSEHQYSFTEENGEVVVKVSAGGGLIVISYYEGTPPAKSADAGEINPLQVMMENAGLIVEWDETDGTIYTDLSYGDEERNKYDLYIPTGASKTDELGVILYVHGGSWTSGDKENESPDCKRYAKAGYITASMNYTLADGSLENNINKMVDEIQACVSALKEELTERGYNVTKMAIGGNSAGAHLASLYAYSRAEVSSLPVVLVINKVGPSDMNIDTWAPLMGEDAVAAVLSIMVSEPITAEQMRNGEVEEQINSVSPAHFVNTNSCASVLAYGANDSIVPKGHYEKLTEALEEAEVDYTFILYPNSGHELGGDKDKTEELISTVKAYLNKYFGY